MNTSKCLLICGPECSARIRQSVLPHLDFELELVEVEFKEQFLPALETRRPPLCVVEWRIPLLSSLKDDAALRADGAPPEIAAVLAGALMETVPVHTLFAEASARSPDTRFIIACHNRGYDVVKAHADEYMAHPAVIKRMGFINGLVNMRYLAKILTRTYEARSWHPTF